MGRKIFMVVVTMALALSVIKVCAQTENGGADVPQITYYEPGMRSIVDLTDKDVLTFKWSVEPVPVDGRVFRFVCKDSQHNNIFFTNIDAKTFSIDVPANKFSNKQIYTWAVQPKDAAGRWRVYKTYSFEVRKE